MFFVFLFILTTLIVKDVSSQPTPFPFPSPSPSPSPFADTQTSTDPIIPIISDLVFADLQPGRFTWVFGVTLVASFIFCNWCE
jgi:hypothetical protein